MSETAGRTEQRGDAKMYLSHGDITNFSTKGRESCELFLLFCTCIWIELVRNCSLLP